MGERWEAAAGKPLLPFDGQVGHTWSLHGTVIPYLLGTGLVYMLGKQQLVKQTGQECLRLNTRMNGSHSILRVQGARHPSLIC